MTKEEFQAYEQKYAETIERIRMAAHEMHQSVNHIYGDNLPYGYHLDMVAEGVSECGYQVCAQEYDVLPLFFSAFYHDSIEDARMTYNDVMKAAKTLMTDEQALMATEIVYALTNDKGRTRAERAGEKYYQGIRETPYAPFVKLCDRLANVTFTCSEEECGINSRMKTVYKDEMPHFLQAINPHSDDVRFQVPSEMVEALVEILVDEEEHDEILSRWKAL